MYSLLVIADDATGALEAGAILADRGFDTEVQFGAFGDPRARAGVLLTPTRHDAPAVARERAATALATLGFPARALDGRRLYWKTDSTLRGPIGACFDALRGVFPATPIVYIPAYPAMGRTVRGGVLLVDGTPLARTCFAGAGGHGSAVAERIGHDLHCPIEAVRSAKELRVKLSAPSAAGPAPVLVCDAEEERDVEALMAECRNAPRVPLVAGPAGGAGPWAGRRGAAGFRPDTLAAISDWLVVCGSRHRFSRELVHEAAGRGLRVLTMPDAEAESPEKELAALAGRAAREAWEGLVIFGGDTVLAVSRALGVTRLRPLGEPLPGVAASRAGEFTFVTKAGGFVAPELFDVLLAGKTR